MRAVLLLVFLTVPAFGQSALRPCDSNGYITNWTNCQGTVTFPSGERYVGEWRDGKFNGQGINTWPIGNEYVGGFREGMRHGQGTYTWADGDKYVGEFRDDKRHGQGILIHADGRPPLEGEWEDAKFVRAQRIPEGQRHNQTVVSKPQVAQSMHLQRRHSQTLMLLVRNAEILV